MIIAGFVVQCHPLAQQETIAALEAFTEVEVFGADEKGNIITVTETASSADLEELVKRIEKIEQVLTVGMTYLNMEDEADQIALGAFRPEPFLRKVRQGASRE